MKKNFIFAIEIKKLHISMLISFVILFSKLKNTVLLWIQVIEKPIMKQRFC